MSSAEYAREGLIQASEALVHSAGQLEALTLAVDSASATAVASVGNTAMEEEIMEVAGHLHSRVSDLQGEFRLAADKYLELSRRFL